MANYGDGNVRHGGGNRRLEGLWTARMNLRDCEARALPHREARLSSRGDRDLRRARRREIPAPPEFSESDEEGIRHRRYRDCDSSTDEEVEQWILGKPRFTAQPRYLHHLQPLSASFSSYHHLQPSSSSTRTHTHKQRPKNISKPSTNSRQNSHSKHQSHDHYHSNPPTSSSSSPYHYLHLWNQHHDHDEILHPTPLSPPFSSHHCLQTTKYKPSNHRFTNTQIDSSHNHHTRETLKTPNPKFENTPENQFEITKINSGFSPSIQFHDHHDSVTTKEYHSTEIPLQPQNLASTNSNSKPRPTLSGNRSPTLTDMMHFVSNWFNCEETLVDESAESERINRIESELIKNETGDDVFCDALGDRVGGFGNSIQEKLVDCFDVVKNEGNDKMELKHTGAGILKESENIAKIERDLCTWNSMISGYVSNGLLDLVVEMLNSMRLDGFEPDVFTWNTVMDAYCRTGLCDEAWKIFEHIKEPSIISWTILISGYSRIGKHEVSLSIFRDMMHCGASADSNSFSSMLVSCRHLGALMCGKEIHSYGVKADSGFGFYSSAGPALLTIYAKHGRIQDAKRLKALGDASSVVCQIVGTLCMGFENVKTKGARRRQWQIAWSFPAFRWTIVLVPLWISDELRRDFSVGVYHSHKSNRGLRFIVVLLVIFRVLQPNSRSSSFQRKGD